MNSVILIGRLTKDPELRFIDEFFWFWSLSLDSSIDSDEALIAMKEGEISPRGVLPLEFN